MFTTIGAIIGLAVAIVMIVRKTVPAYALILGAFIGGLVGGGNLTETVQAMVSGTQSMMPSVLRILSSGVLVGVLVKTGSAAKIADAIVSLLGARYALAAVAIATAVVCSVGVFIDIAVITVAPVALAVGRKANIPVPALLIAMIGGGKAGNIVSPNPNTIAAADAFKVDITALIAANIIPALCTLVFAIAISFLLAARCRKKGYETNESLESNAQGSDLPAIWSALSGPATVVALLSLRPLFSIAVDPLIALPAGGIVSALACGKWKSTMEFAQFGLGKVTGVAVLLIGTGTIAGIVKASGLNSDMIVLLKALHLPMAALAPVSGILMAGATASTTAGATIASQTFAGALTQAGVPALAAAATVHAGATVVDSLPHGSFFHATGGSVFMGVKDRLKLIPFEAAVGLMATVSSVVVNLVV